MPSAWPEQTRKWQPSIPTTKKEENGTETVAEQPAAAEEADQGEDQQPNKKRGLGPRTIDWSDQATLSPSHPKNFTTIEELESKRQAKRKEQQEITKAAKAAKRKQNALAEKASRLTNEELLEIVQQRRHRQETKAKKEKAKQETKTSKAARASTG